MGNVGHGTLRKLAACLLMELFFLLCPSCIHIYIYIFIYILILVLFDLWLIHLALEDTIGPKLCTL